jgi:hypothetical protein
MTSIYKHAQKVPIWLGGAEDDSGLAVEHLYKFAIKLKEAQRPGENDLTVAQRWIQDPNWAPFGPDKSLNDRIWTAILKLFSRNWWTRVWIAQEATVPNQQNWVLCGRSCISWLDLKRVMNLLMLVSFSRNTPRAVTLEDSNLSDALDSAVILWDFQHMRLKEGQGLRLIDLLPKFRCFKATNNRDLVYALLGMAEVDRALYPKPDYKKSEMDVYTDVVQYLIKTSPYGHKLDILGHTEDYYEPESSLDQNDLRTLLTAAHICNENVAAYLNDPNTSTALLESLMPVFETALQVTRNDMRYLESPAYGRFVPKELLDLSWRMANLVDNLKVWSTSPSDIDDNVSFADLAKYFQDIRSLLPSELNFDPVGFSEARDRASKFLALIEPLLSHVVKQEKSDGDGAGLQESSVVPVNISRHENPILMESWPSWVPDWRRPNVRMNPLPKEFIPSQDTAQGSISRQPVYSASGLHPEVFTSHESSVLVTFERGELRILGFRVDKVKKLALLDFPVNNKEWSELQKLVPVDISSDYFTGESITEAFRRTVTADLQYSAFSVPIARGGSILQSDAQSSTAEFAWLSNPFPHCKDRQLAITVDNLMGLVSVAARVGDEIYVLAGGQVLYVLRPQRDCFQFISECYVHGLMDGEALDRLKDGTAEIQTVRIR